MAAIPALNPAIITAIQKVDVHSIVPKVYKDAQIPKIKAVAKVFPIEINFTFTLSDVI
jgi:hypothetical protein